MFGTFSNGGSLSSGVSHSTLIESESDYTEVC